MGSLIATFDDESDLETATSRLAGAQQTYSVRVVQSLAERDEQPLPPEIGGGSQVPIATPTAATGRDVPPGQGHPHPEGMEAPAIEDLVDAAAGDQAAAEHYRRVIAGGGSIVIVEGSAAQLDEAERLLRASRPSELVRYGNR